MKDPRDWKRYSIWENNPYDYRKDQDEEHGEVNPALTLVLLVGTIAAIGAAGILCVLITQ